MEHLHTVHKMKPKQKRKLYKRTNMLHIIKRKRNESITSKIKLIIHMHINDDIKILSINASMKY